MAFFYPCITIKYFKIKTGNAESVASVSPALAKSYVTIYLLFFQISLRNSLGSFLYFF